MAWKHSCAARNELSEVWKRSPAGSIDVAAAWIEFEMLRIEFELARIEFEKSSFAGDS